MISQDPRAKADLQPGATVTIVVSKGPATFLMPNVVGMSDDAAVQLLESEGLTVDVIQIQGFDGHTVLLQKPASGTTVHVGDTVQIYVG